MESKIIMITREIKCLSCGNIFTIAIEDNIDLFSEKLQILRQKLVDAETYRKHFGRLE